MFDYRFELFRVVDKVDVDIFGGRESGEDVKVVDDVIEVGGNDEGGDGIISSGESFIGGFESSFDFGGEIEDEGGFVNLDGFGIGGFEGF